MNAKFSLRSIIHKSSKRLNLYTHYLYATFFMIGSSYSAQAATQRMRLFDAVNSQLIAIDITGNNFGGFFIGKCIQAELINRTTDTLAIDINNGAFLKSVSSTVQDAVITGHDVIYLHPKEGKKQLLYAMGTNHALQAPKLIDKYLVRENYSVNVTALANMIDTLELNCYTGYTAMQAMFQKDSITKILGGVVSKVNALRRLVATATNQQFVDYSTDINVYINPILRQAKVGEVVNLGIDGSYFFQGRKDVDQVEMVLFDKTGKVMRHIPYEPLLYGSSGLMLRNLSVSNLPGEDTYFARLMVNKKLEREWRIEIS